MHGFEVQETKILEINYSAFNRLVLGSNPRHPKNIPILKGLKGGRVIPPFKHILRRFPWCIESFVFCFLFLEKYVFYFEVSAGAHMSQ